MVANAFHPELQKDLSVLLKHLPLQNDGQKYEAYSEAAYFLGTIFTPEVWAQWDDLYASKYQGWSWGTKDLVYNSLMTWGQWVIDRTWTWENMRTSETTRQFFIADMPQRMRTGWKTGVRVAIMAVEQNWGQKIARMLAMLPLEVFRVIEVSERNKPHDINARTTSTKISPRVGCPAARHFHGEERSSIFSDLWRRVQIIHDSYSNLGNTLKT